MSNVKQEYLKNKNDEVFSPISSSNSIYYDSGNNLDPKCILATFNGDKKFTATAAWQIIKIPMDYAFANINDGFSVSDGDIVVKEGIKCIRANAIVNVWSSPTTAEFSFTLAHQRSGKNIKVFCNDSSKDASTAGLLGITIPTCVFTDLQAGDHITTYFVPAATGNYTIIGRGNNTYIYAEKIC